MKLNNQVLRLKMFADDEIISEETKRILKLGYGIILKSRFLFESKTPLDTNWETFSSFENLFI